MKTIRREIEDLIEELEAVDGNRHNQAIRKLKEILERHPPAQSHHREAA